MIPYALNLFFEWISWIMQMYVYHFAFLADLIARYNRGEFF